MSAQSAIAGALSNGFEREEIDGVEYLVHDVVAQREGVYTYPDPNGGVMREFVPAEELKDSIEGVEEATVLVSHPDAPEGPELTTNPRANWTEVGVWRDHRPTADGDGIAGRVGIRINEIGDHDGKLLEYINRVNQTGIGEVSTGYAIGRAEASPGRHNGMAYEAVQRDIRLDHLALLPEDQGDCSVEDGCGLGRANQGDEATARVNNHFPTDDAPRQTPTGGKAEVTEGSDPIRSLGRQVAEAIGLDGILDGQTTPAESGTEKPHDMEDEERINELVEEHGFTRENVAPLVGTDCLTRIHEAVVEQEGSAETNMGTDPDDPESGSGDGTTLTEERVHEIVQESVQDEVSSAVDEALEDAEVQQVEVENLDEEEIVETAAEQAAEKAEEARAHEENVELIAESDNLPHIDRERAERMNEEVVAEIAEDLETEDGDDGGSRANQAGRPTGASFDPADYDSSGEYEDIPAGAPALGESGGDD